MKDLDELEHAASAVRRRRERKRAPGRRRAKADLRVTLAAWRDIQAKMLPIIRDEASRLDEGFRAFLRSKEWSRLCRVERDLDEDSRAGRPSRSLTLPRLQVWELKPPRARFERELPSRDWWFGHVWTVGPTLRLTTGGSYKYFGGYSADMAEFSGLAELGQQRLRSGYRNGFRWLELSQQDTRALQSARAGIELATCSLRLLEVIGAGQLGDLLVDGLREQLEES